MAGKTNTKQICVFKTQKALVEFMDDTRYEKEAMAWPHSSTSRIRIHAKDYSEGTGELAVDAFYNFSPDEFYRFLNAVMRTKPSISSDYNRVKRQLERLYELKKSSQGSASSHSKELIDLANQFASSPNEVFSEAGEKLKSILGITLSQPQHQDNTMLDKMIRETEAELEEIKATKELFSEVKILNYPQYANPENEEERRVTMIKMAYKPHMNYPYVLTVGNGWGIPLITRLKGTVIKEGSTRFVDTVNICLDEKGLYPMLKRTELFLQAMTTHGLTKYFETVTNPVLSYTIEQDQD